MIGPRRSPARFRAFKPEHVLVGALNRGDFIVLDVSTSVELTAVEGSIDLDAAKPNSYVTLTYDGEAHVHRATQAVWRYTAASVTAAEVAEHAANSEPKPVCDFPWVGEDDQAWHRCDRQPGHKGDHKEDGKSHNLTRAERKAREAWSAGGEQPSAPETHEPESADGLPKGRGKPNLSRVPEDVAAKAFELRQAGKTFPAIRDELGLATADKARDAYIAGCYNRGEQPGIKHRSAVEAARYGGTLVERPEVGATDEHDSAVASS